MDLIDIHREFHPDAAECRFFSSIHATFTRIHYMLRYNANLSKFKSVEIVWSTLSNHNTRLEINYRGKKSVHMARTHGDFMYSRKQPVDHWRIQRGNQRPSDKWKWKDEDSKSKGCSKSNSVRKVYSNTFLL